MGGKPPMEAMGPGEGSVCWAPECGLRRREHVARIIFPFRIWCCSAELPVSCVERYSWNLVRLIDDQCPVTSWAADVKDNAGRSCLLCYVTKDHHPSSCKIDRACYAYFLSVLSGERKWCHSLFVRYNYLFFNMY
jgi:hypothetical protein